MGGGYGDLGDETVELRATATHAATTIVVSMCDRSGPVVLVVSALHAALLLDAPDLLGAEEHSA
jgi:hypothetical protein